MAESAADYSGDVPVVEVAWSEPPSFNTPPDEGGRGDGGSTDSPPIVPPLDVDLGSVRAAESSMLSTARSVVASYEALRALTLRNKSGSLFGPNKHNPVTDPHFGATPPDHLAQDEVAEYADKFTAAIVPAMELALLQAGNALELVGQYIAMVNRSGQLYAAVDRSAAFSDDVHALPVHTPYSSGTGPAVLHQPPAGS